MNNFEARNLLESDPLCALEKLLYRQALRITQLNGSVRPSENILVGSWRGWGWAGGLLSVKVFLMRKDA